MILLPNADFNTLQNIVFSTHMKSSSDSLHEIFSGRKGQSENHEALNKKVISDMPNQFKLTSIVVSNDATNFL